MRLDLGVNKARSAEARANVVHLFHFGPLHGDDIAVALGSVTSVIVILLLLDLAKKKFDPSQASTSITRTMSP